MMKKVFEKFGGVIFFYLAIVGTIVAVNYRFAEINNNETNENLAYVITK